MIIPSISQATDSTNLASCTGGSSGQNGGNETDVFAGQKMLLCVLAPPTGLSIVSGHWSFDDVVDISGGFVDGNGDVGTQPSASVGGSDALDPDLTQNGIQFYFVNPGTTETATYHWTLYGAIQSSMTCQNWAVRERLLYTHLNLEGGQR